MHGAGLPLTLPSPISRHKLSARKSIMSRVKTVSGDTSFGIIHCGCFVLVTLLTVCPLNGTKLSFFHNTLILYGIIDVVKPRCIQHVNIVDEIASFLSSVSICYNFVFYGPWNANVLSLTLLKLHAYLSWCESFSNMRYSGDNCTHPNQTQTLKELFR